MLTSALPRPFQRRIKAWFEAKNPASDSNIVLHHRRLYILPTRFGYLFSLLLLFLFLAAINYQNSMAFVLVFMLTSLAIISLWQTHKNLLGISVKLNKPQPVFIDEDSEFIFVVENSNTGPRYSIGIQYVDQPPEYLNLQPMGRESLTLNLPAQRRGQFKPQGVIVFSRYPTGLFHTWGWLKFDQPVMVYSKPISRLILKQTLADQDDGNASTNTTGGSDFAGLREHRESESLRHISWKAYAQGRGLLTKTFQGQTQPSLWIDWDELPEGSTDEKLALMTTWVLAADAEGRKYGLRLPKVTLQQNSGNAHKHLCLSTLATFKQFDFNQAFTIDPD